MAEEQKIELHYTLHSPEERLPIHWGRLLQQARMASDRAHSPYSGFCVGCALELQDGTVVTGNNQENAAYPSGLCAERTAFFHASSYHPKAIIRRAAIFAHKWEEKEAADAAPCGACRQVMLEYEQKQQQAIPLLFRFNEGHWVEAPSVQALLPFVFNF